MAHRCCGVMLGRHHVARAANSHTSPLPLYSSSIMYFRGIVRDEAWNSLTDTARSHADHELGIFLGTGLGLTVIQKTVEGVHTVGVRGRSSCVGGRLNRPDDNVSYRMQMQMLQ